MSSRTSHPLAWLAAGLLVLAAGVALARAHLPEWRSLPPRGEGFYVERFEELARRAGIALTAGQPRVGLGGSRSGFDPPLAPLDGREPGAAPLPGEELLVEVEQHGLVGTDGRERRLVIGFNSSGQARTLAWELAPLPGFLAAMQGARPDRTTTERFARLLLAPGERLGGGRTTLSSGTPTTVFDVAGSRPPRHLVVHSPAGGAVVRRAAGDAAWGFTRARRQSVERLLLRVVSPMLGLIAVLVLFVVLASRRHIDLVNGAVLAAVAAAVALPSALAGHLGQGDLASEALGILAQALWIFLLWSAGESLIRSTYPDFTTSLDSLRVGRIGPRAGRALLVGLGLGAAFAGLMLAVLAAAVALPGAWPEALAVPLPVFGGIGNPVARGILLAATVVAIVAFARRLLPPRWAPWAAALVLPAFVSPVHVHPRPLQIAVALALGGLLVFAGRRFGLTALLAASIAAMLLPATAFSAVHRAWLPGSFAASAVISAALLALGLAGLRRPAEVEMGRLVPPRFMRRLEEERRVRYEMDLLARMQKGLLPERVPQPDGWEIAAHSQLATEAGGDLYDFLHDGDGHLWIAVGDVAGHGYSCAIVQAMTFAALASLVAPGRTPAQVLQQVDRVIRRGGQRRNFTSLALLRLDPRTGRGLFANAGHPYPLLALGGEVRDIVLPGLPLGHGPRREYDDLEIELAPGSVLVFCSDGLVEAADWRGNPYGFERPGEVLRTAARRPAAAIVEALLADWRRHLRNEEPPDDTTVLVIKRAAG